MQKDPNTEMKPYPKYKPSGIEWIGNIPEHWKISRLKRIVKGKLEYGANERAEIDDESVPRYIRITDFDENGRLRKDTFKSLPFEIAKDYLLENGDILFARSGATVGKTFQFKDYDGFACFAGYLIRARPNEGIAKSDFLYLYTQSNAYENWKDSIFCQATIQNISADKYRELEIPIPPLPEQQKISDYIHRQIGKIDYSIGKNQKLIELLKEHRAAIINQAVTKGLNPNVKMKDSGVEWLGEIPEHWDVLRSKWIFRLGNGYAFKGELFSKEDVDAPILITPGNFSADGGLYFNDSNTKRYLGEFPEEFVLNKQDLVMVLTDLSYKNLILGRAEFVTEDGLLLNQRIAKCIINDNYRNAIDQRYLRYFLNNEPCRQELIPDTTGATVNHTSPTKIGNRMCLVPPFDEQREIADFIDFGISRMDLAMSRIKEELELLQEYRSALISEAVTGKIDAREE